MKQTAEQRPGALALVTMLAPIAWGTTYLTVTEFLPPERPRFVAAMRVLPAGVALLAIGRARSPWRPIGREWRRLSMLALLNFALFFPLLIAGAYRLPGGVAAAVGGVQPLLVSTLSWIMFRRRPRGRELWLGVVAVVGVGLVVVRPGAGLSASGIACAFAANVSFAMGVVLTKRHRPFPNVLAATGWQLLIAGALLVPFSLVIEGAPPRLGWSAIGGGLYLSLVATAVAFVLWFRGVHGLPSAAPPLLGLAGPTTGAILGWIVLDQSLSLWQLLGFAITLAAIARGATLKDRHAAHHGLAIDRSVLPANSQTGDETRRDAVESSASYNTPA